MNEEILQLHDWISSVGFGLVFVISVVSIIYCISYLSEKTKQKTKEKKFLFYLASSLSIIFVLTMLFAWDIQPNLSPELTAKNFAAHLYNRTLRNYEKKKKQKILVKDYIMEFNQKAIKFENDVSIILKKEIEDFTKIEGHYSWKCLQCPEKYVFVLETSDTTEFLKKQKDILEYDLRIKVSLQLVWLNSMFLGKYPRWKVDGFLYSKGSPYKLIEKLKKLKQKIN